MANPALLVSQFNGSLALTDTEGAGTWTGVAPVRYDGGLWVEKAATNYIRNPKAFSTLGAATTSGVTLTRDTTQTSVGYPTCYKIVSANLAPNEFAQFQALPSFTGQVPYVASAMVWASAPGTTVKIFGILWESGYASNDQNSATFVVGTTPTEITVTVTMDASVTVFDAYIRIGTDTQAASTIYAANLQFEPAPQTSYIDGSLGDGYAWTGTAHLSPSTRTASSVSVDQDTVARIDPSSGSIAFRYKRLIDTGAEETILTSGVVGSGTDYLEIGIDSSDHLYMEWDSDNGGANRVTSTGTISTDTEYFLYFEWDGTDIGLSIDNGTIETDTRDAVEGDWSTGDLSLSAATGSVVVGPFAIYDRALIANEVSTLYTTGGWNFDLLQDLGVSPFFQRSTPAHARITPFIRKYPRR